MLSFSKALTVREVDGTPSVPDARTLIFPNGSLTDNGNGSVTYTSSGAVSSVFARTGAVVADSADYAAYYAQLTAANVFTQTQVVTGSVIARQSGGTPGTDEIQISHDGTNAAVVNKSGVIRLMDHTGSTVRGTIYTEFGGWVCVSTGFEVGGGGIGPGATSRSFIVGAITLVGSDVLRWVPSDFAPPDSGIARPGVGFLKITDGGSGDGSVGGIFRPVTLADAAAPNNSIYYSSDAAKLVYKDGGGVVNNLY